jgi:hypothetical protein
MDVVAPLVAHLQPPKKAVKPRHSVLSTTHLCPTSLSLNSMPRRAMRGVMPLFLSPLVRN